MANLSFEGDVDGISEEQLEFVRNILDERGYKNERVQVSAVGKAGDNYVANVKRFVVEKNGETFKMVGKIAPTFQVMRDTMQTHALFHNEHFMYTYVLPKFTELEKEANVPEEERLRYAKCYGSQPEEPNEIILLEDMVVSDFVMLDRFISLTDDSVKLVLKNFAILHSLSFALKNRDQETYEGFKEQLLNHWVAMTKTDEIKAYFDQLEADVMSMLENEEHVNVLKGSLSRLQENAVKNFAIDKDSKYTVIIQGDSWTNNILFKLKGGKTMECCMIDYQLSNQSSPVSDIHYMIFNCTDLETRFKHYHEWIDYYHTQLDECLSRFGLDIDVTYPRAELDADLKRLGKVSFGLSLMLASMLMRESHEAAIFKEAMQVENNMEELMNISKLSNMEQSSMVRFKARVDGLITSFLELGYLEVNGKS